MLNSSKFNFLQNQKSCIVTFQSSMLVLFGLTFNRLYVQLWWYHSYDVLML